MYLEHWGLKEFPFANVPDFRFLFQAPAHREALIRMAYLCQHQHGAGMIVGPFGSGKTLLAYALLNVLGREDTFRSAFVQNPMVTPIELLQLVTSQLGLREVPTAKSSLLLALERLLQDNVLDGRHTIILIDEAHSIADDRTFEEVRLLLNFQLEDAFLITLLLLGQPGLEARIDSNKPLAQRIGMVAHLNPLTLEETQGYVRHRLKVAGGEAPLFTPEAFAFIHRFSGGLPRRINQVCDACLLEGFLKGAKEVSGALAERAADQLRLAGPRASPPRP